jgi:hypothetical protein
MHFFFYKHVYTNQLQAAYQYIAKGLSPHSASFILYPYSFTGGNTTTAFNEGAIISTNAAGLDSGALFKYISGDTSILSSPIRNINTKLIAIFTTQYKIKVSSSLHLQDITLQRAQALYDVNIAILQLSLPSSGAGIPPTDLTYEAYTYCSVLYNYLSGKYDKCWTGDAYLNDVKTNAATREATSVVYVNETDINGGILFYNSM